MTELAVIGAGPYGLSLAAHLNTKGVDFRVFGPPMHTWLNHMPKGMRLKSEGFASSLHDPTGALRLKEYCRYKGLPYEDEGLPVQLDIFSSYGLEFQRRFVPNLENNLVTGLQQDAGGFKLSLATGEEFAARRVVIAVGLTYFANIPEVLSGFPEELVAHSYRYGSVDDLRGREVAIVGAGASAIDLAVVLQQAGAQTQVIARGPRLRFQSPPELPRPLGVRMRAPMTGIGPGWRNVFCTEAPLAFRLLPEEIRLKAVQKILGPAPCWFTRDEIEGKVQVHLERNVTGASVRKNRMALELTDPSGSKELIEADHVVAATGYKPDLRKIKFLGDDLRSRIDSVVNSPVLTSNFESTVKGLYFIGIPAANTFGPVLRFAYGAGFASKRLSKHLAGAMTSGLVRVSAPADRDATREETHVNSLVR